MTASVVANSLRDSRDYLLDLERGLRAADTARDKLNFACAALGKFLDAAAVGFLELEADGVAAYIGSEWLSGEINSMAGRHNVIEYGAGRLPALKAGDAYAVDDIDDHPLTQDASVREAIRKLGVRAFLEVPLVRGGELRGWLYVSRTRPHRWSKDEIALVSETLERSWETLERARSEERLREQEVRLKAVLEQMPVGVILASIPDGDLFLYNKRSAEIMGHDMLGHDLSDYGAYGGIHEDGSPFRAEEYPTARAVVGGETIVGERIRYRRPDGSVAHLSVSAAPIRTPYGDFAVCSFEDQTELHKALEREQLLNAELQHRVKNLLATVQAIASQTVGSAEERAAFEGRLQALGSAQDLLAQSGWEGVLEDLVARALEPFAQSARIAASGPSVKILPRQAVPFALALHELATNACKYGALSNETGRVTIAWEMDEQDAFSLVWREHGGPPVAYPQRRGFGSRLLERGLAMELAGKVRLDFEPDGVVCTITARLT